MVLKSILLIIIGFFATHTLGLSTSNGKNFDFCVAKADADCDKLQAGLNWACGQGGVDCTAIQHGQPCFLPNTYQNHASYAYNDYYQKNRCTGATCDFGGTGTITFIDPSYGCCEFSKSATFTPNSNGGFSQQVAHGTKGRQ